MKGQVITFALATVGAVAFDHAGLPLPFLFGPIAACMAAALCGLRLKGFGQVGVAARTILGVAVGASITPAVIDQVPAMAASVALVPVYLLVIGLVGVPYFHRVAGYDKATAYFAAMPGGLPDMVAFGQEAGGDVRALSLIHATRVAILVTVAPIVATAWFGATLDNPLGAPARSLPPHEMAFMVLAALIGWQGAVRLKLFGASILGPMIVTAALSLGDVIHSRPPAEAILAAQFFIGAGLGVHYVGIRLAEIRRYVLSSAIHVGLLALLAAGFARLVTSLGLAPPLDAFLAFSPGGQAEMTVLSIVIGADLGYVIVHHLTRLVLVIAGAPIAARLLGLKPPKPPD